MTPIELYELCVTDPPRLVRFLRAVHGRNPRVLREDFCGSAAVARFWCGGWGAGQVPKSEAIAVDKDSAVLAYARSKGVRTIAVDAAKCRAKADVISATNFPIGYWHTRHELVDYLRGVRASLRPRGVFVCDMYGGETQWHAPATTRQTMRIPGGGTVEYVWTQAKADAVSGLVTDTLSFRVKAPKAKRWTVHRDAFVYNWRLWSIPELTDAMAEAGFRSTEVYDRMGDAVDSDGRLYVRPVVAGEGLDTDWVVYLAARK